MKLELSLKISEKFSNIKFHENPSSGSRVFHVDGRTDGQTNMTKLIVAFRNFANAPKKEKKSLHFRHESKPDLSAIEPVA
jgi:hypothetical protein